MRNNPYRQFESQLLRQQVCRFQGKSSLRRARPENPRKAAGFSFVCSAKTTRTREVGINIALAATPSGCVIWIMFDQNTVELGPFLWFGGEPGKPLPPLATRLAGTRKATRTDTRLNG